MRDVLSIHLIDKALEEAFNEVYYDGYPETLTHEQKSYQLEKAILALITAITEIKNCL